MLRTVLLILICSSVFSLLSQEEQEADSDMSSLWRSIQGQDPLVDSVLSNHEKYRFQFSLTVIDRTTGEYQIQNSFSNNTQLYFYPASTVKLPVAILTLEKLQKKGLSLNSTLSIHDDQYCGNMTYAERLRKRKISMREIIEEMITVSDNHYYNALFQFLTPKNLNDSLQNRGLVQTKIYKSFTGCEFPKNLFCNSLHVNDPETKKTINQSSSTFPLDEFSSRYKYDSTKLLGSKHEYRKKIVPGPFDFNYNLEYSLSDLHTTMLRLVAPTLFPESSQWHLTTQNHDFLMQTLLQAPCELSNKKFKDLRRYPDNLYKYLIHGNGDTKYNHISSYSKIGISYGFVTETGYFVDEKTGKEFVLTTSIYVNENDTVNDGNYEYDEIARPFMAKFGQLILNWVNNHS